MSGGVFKRIAVGLIAVVGITALAGVMKLMGSKVVIVRDPAGTPVEDATVVVSSERMSWTMRPTNGDGLSRITVGYADEPKWIDVSHYDFTASHVAFPGAWPLEVSMQPLPPRTRPGARAANPKP
jgi:hypothetical protein